MWMTTCIGASSLHIVREGSYIDRRSTDNSHNRMDKAVFLLVSLRDTRKHTSSFRIDLQFRLFVDQETLLRLTSYMNTCT